MNENIQLKMNTSVKKQRSIRTSIALFSQDVDNYSFDITFADLELEAGDQIEVLAKLPGGKVEHKSSANLVEVDGRLIARYVFDTNLIVRKGHVFCYVYLKRGDKSADVGAFYFEADLSELDKVGGKIAEVYDGRYEDLVAGFEIKLQEYHDIVEANETERIQAEQARKEAETLREESYEQKVDTAIVEADVVEKVDNKVTELTPRMNELTAQLAQKVDKGNVSVSDINKNLGKLDQTFMSDEFLQQMAGNTPINAVPADGSITSNKLANDAVTRMKLSTELRDNINKFFGERKKVTREINSRPVSYNNNYWLLNQPNLEVGVKYAIEIIPKQDFYYDDIIFLGEGESYVRPHDVLAENVHFVKDQSFWIEDYELSGTQLIYLRIFGNTDKISEVNVYVYEEVEGLIDQVDTNLSNVMEELTDGSVSNSKPYLFGNFNQLYHPSDFLSPKDLADTQISDVYNIADNLISDQKGVSRNLWGYGSDIEGNEDLSLPIYEYIIQNPKNNTSKWLMNNSPTILISSGLHGNEKGAVWSTLQFMVDLLNEQNESLDSIKSNVIVKVLLIANPYGFNNNIRLNARGVDLNRNFGYKWYDNTEQTKGDAPYSELESSILAQWLNANSGADFYIDFHNIPNGNIPAENISYLSSNGILIKHIYSSVIRRLADVWSNRFGIDFNNLVDVWTETNNLPGTSNEAYHLNQIDRSGVLEIGSKFSGILNSDEVVTTGEYLLVNMILGLLDEYSS